jgi:PhnB protein
VVNPYITFEGECSQALDFYQAAFQTEIGMLQSYGNYVPEGVNDPPANLSDWILHAEMDICGTKFWFADEAAEPVKKGNMVKLTAMVANAGEARQIFEVLSKDAHITLPPTETFYSTFHAGLTDKFGVSWNITAEEAPHGKEINLK